MLEHRPQLRVCAATFRINIEPQAAAEDYGVLRDDGQPGAEIVQPQRADADVINEDVAAGRFDDAEE